MTLRVNKYSKFIASKLFYYNLPCATEIWETALLTFIKIYSLEVTVPVWWKYHVLGCHWASLPNSLFWDVMLAAWNWSLWEYLHDGNWQELQILKEINFWIFIKRDDVETEALILWPPDVEKTLMLGKTEGRRRRGWQRMCPDVLTACLSSQALRATSRKGLFTAHQRSVNRQLWGPNMSKAPEPGKRSSTTTETPRISL